MTTALVSPVPGPTYDFPILACGQVPRMAPLVTAARACLRTYHRSAISSQSLHTSFRIFHDFFMSVPYGVPEATERWSRWRQEVVSFV